MPAHSSTVFTVHFNDLVTYLENEGVAGVELWEY